MPAAKPDIRMKLQASVDRDWADLRNWFLDVVHNDPVEFQTLADALLGGDPGTVRQLSDRHLFYVIRLAAAAIGEASLRAGAHQQAEAEG
jgi:hypothetical protein